MQPNPPKILIISSDTGGGHRSAAKTIADGVERFWKGESAAVRTIKAVENSHHLTEKMVRGYNGVLHNKQHWMKYLYWFVNRIRPETREFFHKRCIGYVRGQFEKWCPHVVVSVHPLTQHIFGRILRELNLKDQVPLVTVVTDPCYGFWKGWACDDVSLYLVASDDARRQLIDYGISPDRIKISGMPVHPKFDFPGEQAAQSARLAFSSFLAQVNRMDEARKVIADTGTQAPFDPWWSYFHGAARDPEMMLAELHSEVCR